MYTNINNVQILNCQSNLIMHISVWVFFQLFWYLGLFFFNFPWPSLSESYAYCFSWLWSVHSWLTLSSYTNCPGLHGSSLHAQVDIRSRGNASNVINDADDDFLIISQIISQNMLATVWVCFDPHPIPRRKQGEHSVRMLIIQ